MIKLLLTLNVDENLKKILDNKVNNIDLDMETYILQLIKKDIESILYLEEDFYFDINKNKLFNGNKEINLTRNQFKIFKYLLDNQNRIITYEQLEQVLKDVTRDSIRNFMMQLRTKTYRHLIKTVNNNGYIMSINNFSINIKQ